MKLKDKMLFGLLHCKVPVAFLVEHRTFASFLMWAVAGRGLCQAGLFLESAFSTVNLSFSPSSFVPFVSFLQKSLKVLFLENMGLDNLHLWPQSCQTALLPAVAVGSNSSQLPSTDLDCRKRRQAKSNREMMEHNWAKPKCMPTSQLLPQVYTWHNTRTSNIYAPWNKILLLHKLQKMWTQISAQLIKNSTAQLWRNGSQERMSPKDITRA